MTYKPTLPPMAQRTIRRINQLSNAKLVMLLLQGELNCKALAAESGIHYVTVLEYVKAMRAEGALYIDHFEPDERGAMRVRVYRLGFGVDAVPPVLTPKQRSQRYRDAKKQLAHQHAVTSALFALGAPTCPAPAPTPTPASRAATAASTSKAPATASAITPARSGPSAASAPRPTCAQP